MERYYIVHGDKTSSDGTVLALRNIATNNGRNIAVIGDEVTCPQCKSTGRISPTGPRLSCSFYGDEVALHGDLCLCKCDPPPKIIAGLGTICMVIENTGVGSPGSGTHGAITSSESPFSLKPVVYGGSAEENSAQDLEHYFEAVNSNGSPVELFYRIDSEAGKLHEGLLSSSGITPAVPLETAITVRFWSNPT